MLKKMLSALVLLATLCSPATATTLNATPATIAVPAVAPALLKMIGF